MAGELFGEGPPGRAPQCPVAACVGGIPVLGEGLGTALLDRPEHAHQDRSSREAAGADALGERTEQRVLLAAAWVLEVWIDHHKPINRSRSVVGAIRVGRQVAHDEIRRLGISIPEFVEVVFADEASHGFCEVVLLARAQVAVCEVLEDGLAVDKLHHEPLAWPLLVAASCDCKARGGRNADRFEELGVVPLAKRRGCSKEGLHPSLWSVESPLLDDKVLVLDADPPDACLAVVLEADRVCPQGLDGSGHE